MIGVTGASSEIGLGVLRAAKVLGVEAVPIGRSGGPGTRPYDLREPLPDGLLAGVDSIVHLAWAWHEAPGVNVEAGKRLAAACRARDIRPVLLSTFSVFAAQSSKYGAAKLAVETEFLDAGGSALRAAVIWGADPGGIVATLSRLARIPVFAPHLWPDPLLYHSQEADLAAALVRAALGQSRSGIALAASMEAVSLRTLMETLRGERSGLSVPVAVPLLQLVARAGEGLHIPLPFRSDSLSALDRSAGRAIASTDLPWLDGFPGAAAFLDWAGATGRPSGAAT